MFICRQQDVDSLKWFSTTCPDQNPIAANTTVAPCLPSKPWTMGECHSQKGLKAREVCLQGKTDQFTTVTVGQGTLPPSLKVIFWLVEHFVTPVFNPISPGNLSVLPLPPSIIPVKVNFCLIETQSSTDLCHQTLWVTGQIPLSRLLAICSISWFL